MTGLDVAVFHVHNDTEQNVPCDFIESTDSFDGEDILYIFRCQLCQTEIGIKISGKKKEA